MNALNQSLISGTLTDLSEVQLPKSSKLSERLEVLKANVTDIIQALKDNQDIGTLNAMRVQALQLVDNLSQQAPVPMNIVYRFNRLALLAEELKPGQDYNSEIEKYSSVHARLNEFIPALTLNPEIRHT